MNDQANLRHHARRFQASILGKSLSQAVTSFGGFFVTCTAMYLLNDVSDWLSLALAPLAAGFLVRIFIIQHDCGHSSFFRGRRANDVLGFACSLVTLTPSSWRRQHAGHHGKWNDLDRRQSDADIHSSCLTVAEYHALSPWRRWWYRTTRHPLVADTLLPPLVVLGLYRVPFDTPRAWRRERRAVYVTDVTLVAMFGGRRYSSQSSYWHRSSASGYSLYSIGAKRRSGPVTTIGMRPRLRCAVRPTCACRLSCIGLRAISDTTMCTS